jgi:hypothetical protein
MWKAIVIAAIVVVVEIWLTLQLLMPAFPAAEPRQKSKYDEQMFVLDRRALDDAYVDQVKHLIAIWMKDQSNQPERARVGLRQAQRAYIGVMAEIDANEIKSKQQQQQ